MACLGSATSTRVEPPSRSPNSVEKSFHCTGSVSWNSSMRAMPNRRRSAATAAGLSTSASRSWVNRSSKESVPATRCRRSTSSMAWSTRRRRRPAAEGIRALRLGLPEVLADPAGLYGREHALYGSYLAAVAFCSAGSGLHHKICHVLGGGYNLPHAQTHAVVLAYVLAFNAPSVPDAERQIAAAFDADRAITGLQMLREQLDAPRALRSEEHTFELQSRQYLVCRL